MKVDKATLMGWAIYFIEAKVLIVYTLKGHTHEKYIWFALSK
jgi:hypothetical protein